MQLGDYEKSKELFSKTINLLEKFNLIDLDYADVIMDYSTYCLKWEIMKKLKSYLKEAKELYEEAGLVNDEIAYCKAKRLIQMR